MARQFVIMESSGSANSMRALHFEPVGQQRRYWLDCDPVALAVLVIGIGLIEVLAFII
jgi:hypothetical protein